MILSTVYMAAQVLGFDKPDPSQLYNLSDQQLDAVKKKLLELKPNIRKMWTSGGELTNLFQNHEVVAAMGWPLMTNQLRKAKFPVGETIPKENTTGWIDHLMITSGSENKELAYKFLAFMIEAQTQKKVTDVTGYTPANPQAAQFMTPDEIKGLHLDDVDNYQKANLLLAERAAAREVQRNLERSKSVAVTLDTLTWLASANPRPQAASCSIRNLAKSFGKNPVLRDISLDVAEGEFLTILGESGSGKTTLCESSPDSKPPIPANSPWQGSASTCSLPTGGASTPYFSTTRCSLT